MSDWDRVHNSVCSWNFLEGWQVSDNTNHPCMVYNALKFWVWQISKGQIFQASWQKHVCRWMNNCTLSCSNRAELFKSKWFLKLWHCNLTFLVAEPKRKRLFSFEYYEAGRSLHFTEYERQLICCGAQVHIKSRPFTKHSQCVLLYRGTFECFVMFKFIMFLLILYVLSSFLFL